MKSNLLRVSMIAAALAAYGPAARADVDATGRWLVHLDAGLFGDLLSVENMVQSGTTLTSDSGFSGTIVPATGAFSQAGPGGICPPDTRTGTFSLDGRTFTATGTVHFTATPTLCFIGLGVTYTGSRCGQGSLDPGEGCDDGNDVDGDGCSALCQVEGCYQCAGEPSMCAPDVGASCDDGDACTTASACDASAVCVGTAPLDCADASICTEDTCDSALGCIHQPAVRPCRSAAQSRLLLVDQADARDKLVWKWTDGQSTSQMEFADPTSDAAYELCLFAGTAATIVGEARVAPDAQRWRARSDTGYRYRDPAGSADGIQKLLLKGSASDRTTIVLKGRGSALPDPVPPVALPLIVQLRNTDTDICWSATFTEADVNESGKLKAKALAP